MYSDLHAHLGSMTPAHDLWEIAHLQGIKLPTKNYHDFIGLINGENDENSSMDHNKYLNKFNLTQRIQSSPLAVENSIFKALTDAYTRHKTDLIEIRFNPMLRNRDGFFDLDMIITHACIGLKKATAMYPIQAGIIISADRSFDEEKVIVLAKKAIKFKSMGVCGFDVSGASPKNFDIKKFTTAYRLVKDCGIGGTIHTAEVADIGLDEVRYIIKQLGVSRIGHGIQSVKDESTLEMIKEHDVHLEVCPTSNVITKCVNGYGDFKQIFNEFNEHGISYSINTDGNVFLNTNVGSEYSNLIDKGVITIADVDKLEASSRERTFII